MPPGARDELDPDLPAVLERGRPEELVRRGAGWYHAGRYFEAHECFESLWKHPGVPSSTRRIWKGLAQAAAGLCHLERGSLRGGAAVLRRAAATLRGSDLDGAWLGRLVAAAGPSRPDDLRGHAPKLDIAMLLSLTAAAPGGTRGAPADPPKPDAPASPRRTLRDEEDRCTEDGSQS